MSFPLEHVYIETRSKLKPVWVSLRDKISSLCEVTSLSAFTWLRAEWNSLRCKFHFGQFDRSQMSNRSVWKAVTDKFLPQSSLCASFICLCALFIRFALFSFGYVFFSFRYVIILFGYALVSFGSVLFSFRYVLFPLFALFMRSFYVLFSCALLTCSFYALFLRALFKCSFYALFLCALYMCSF